MTSAARIRSDTERDLQNLLGYLAEPSSDEDYRRGPYLMLALGRHLENDLNKEDLAGLLNDILSCATQSAKREAHDVLRILERHGFQIPSRNETDRYVLTRSRSGFALPYAA